MELRRLTDNVKTIDNTEEKILELIEQTADTKDKAFLLILLKLNNSLGDNTRVVTDVAAKLDTHLTMYEEHTEKELADFHKRDGAKKVWSYIIGTIQTIAISMIIYFQTELINIHEEVNNLKMGIAKHDIIIERNKLLNDQMHEIINRGK